MPQEHESWIRQLSQYLLFSLTAAAIVYFYLHVFHANQITVALSFLILILFTAFRRPIVYSIYLAVLSTILYNYYFLPPIRSFTIADPQNLIALVVFLLSAFAVNHISSTERRQARILAEKGQELEKLYAFSQRLLLQDKLQELSNTVPALIAECFVLRAVALYLPGKEAATLWDPDHLLTGMDNLHDATQSGVVSSRSSAGIRIIPLMLGMRPLGVLALAEGPYSEGLYDAIGSLTAVAVERAAALERNSRSEAARKGEILRTALLDSITHELRTPLTSITFAATTLSSQAWLDEESRQDLLAVINEETTRMDALIDEAVTMAQLSTGDVNLHREAVAFSTLLASVLETLRLTLRQHEVQSNISPDMKPVLIDPDLIRRVLRHLVENAVQYSPSGSTIHVTATSTDKKLHVSVANAGLAIPEEDQPFVFDRFFRGANGSSHPNGTGMGLAIVRAIIEAHGGRITVRSTPGIGTQFSFWLPTEAAPAG